MCQVVRACIIGPMTGDTRATGMSLTIPIHVQVVRVRRGRCARCGQRRVRFAFAVEPVGWGMAQDGWESARCAECWELR